MYVEKERWNPVHGEELIGFLEQISEQSNLIDKKYRVSPDTTQVSWCTLPFYDQVAMIRVKDPTWTPASLYIYYLTDKGKLYRLNGISPPIHEVNAQAPVKITEDNVIDYLKFFCFFVRGEEGPFLIAETMDDAYIPRGLDDKSRTVIQGTVRPASYEGRNEVGNFMCTAVVFYSNALFIASFSVQPSGMIEMLDDEPVAADLPVRVEAPIA